MKFKMREIGEEYRSAAPPYACVRASLAGDKDRFRLESTPGRVDARR